jgi:2-amino-4-hydroxy-6-hydroxymethyldihydropteridine diphosphokinase
VVTAAIGLGSNLGDRARLIDEAVSRIAGLGTVAARSSLYESAPIGGPEQGPFLNAVVLLDTELAPRRLLGELLAAEIAMGRERTEQWGPRLIDLDLLLYGDAAIDEPGLTVPHPRLTERRFVLEPLLEVQPGASLPDGRRLAALRESVADQDVTRLSGPEPAEVAFSPSHSWLVVLVVVLGAAAIWWLIDWLTSLLA